ncbi:MAG TPA: hypothetical protein PKM63_17100 [Panacibacter sp.]|nr:hypothetical protein [Panacibacter sp.]HNP46013.1 hypothetical protein [Panacibacter sp.]
MEKSQRIAAQIYGYTVCVVAVITFLTFAVTTVNALLDKSDPIHAGWSNNQSPSLASFDNYKMDIIRSMPQNKDVNTITIPDDNSLRSMYNAAREDKIQTELHRANQSIIIGILMILITVVLFITHWKWMKRMATA